MLSAGAYSFRQKSRLAVSLSWVAGYTNAIAFLMLGSIVVSHVTGNVTHVGLAAGGLADGRPGAAGQALYFGHIVGSFFLGAVASAVMTEFARRRGSPSKYMIPMAVEAVLLVAWAVGIALHLSGRLRGGDPLHHYWMTGVAAAAMGLQNATITRISGAVIRTTHLTGVVTDLGLEAVQYVLWAHDRARRPTGRAKPPPPPPPPPPRARRLARVWKVSRRHPSFQRLLLLAGVFGSFLFGVVAGTLAFDRWPGGALLAPVAFLLWICWVDRRKPIADVRELDLTADPEFGGQAALKALLPDHVGIYRLTHHRRDAQHHTPDFVAWADRLPAHWRVVILAVSPLTHFDANAALNLADAVRKLRDAGRDLVMCGVKPGQYRVLDRGGLFDALSHQNVAPDVELAVARALNVLADLEAEADGEPGPVDAAPSIA